MILGVLRSKWPKGGGRPLYPQLRTFVRNVYLIAITLHNAQLSEKFFHVCLWLSFHWSCIFSHFDNTSDFSQRKQSHYEYQWKMFFSVKDSQSGISWLSFKITRVGREKQVNLGGILARKLMNSFEKAPTVLIVIRRSLHGQPFFLKKWEWRESDFATILKVQSLLFCCCDCNLRRHMGKHYWLSLSFMQECNLLHPISVLQDTFLRWILPIPFFSSSSASKQWKRITSFWPFWGERKVLAMDSWGCVCLFWLLRRISVSHTPLKHLALPQTQLPWTEMFFDAFRSHESLPSLKHAHSPSRHMRTTARTVIKHSEPDT